MNMNIGICDDDSMEVARIKEIVEEYFSSNKIEGIIKIYDSSKVLLEGYYSLDLLFLDIEMPEVNGLAVAEEIRREDRNVRIVFLTNHRNYIQKAFIVQAYRYLFKPYRNTDITEVINHAVKEIITVPGIYLEKKNGDKMWLRYRDIYYIEALGDGSVVYLADDKIITGKALKYWEKQMTEDFVQCHRSYIVNMYFIVKITHTSVFIRKYKGIPLSVRKRALMTNTYLEYIRSNAREI